MAINRPIDHVRFWGLVAMCASIALAVLLPALKIHSVQIHKSMAMDLEAQLFPDQTTQDPTTTNSLTALDANAADTQHLATEPDSIQPKANGTVPNSNRVTQPALPDQSSNENFGSAQLVSRNDQFSNTPVLPDSSRIGSISSDRTATTQEPLMLIDGPSDLQSAVEQPLMTTEAESSAVSNELFKQLSDISIERWFYSNGRVSIYPALAGSFTLGFSMWTVGGAVSDFRRKQQRAKKSKRQRR